MNVEETRTLVWETMNKAGILEFSGKRTATEVGEKHISFYLDGLPNLSILLDLADKLGIDPRAIRTDSEYRGMGCETCGYGGGTRITLQIPIAELDKE